MVRESCQGWRTLRQRKCYCPPLLVDGLSVSGFRRPPAVVLPLIQPSSPAEFHISPGERERERFDRDVFEQKNSMTCLNDMINKNKLISKKNFFFQTQHTMKRSTIYFDRAIFLAL